ncbi:hypothetical protein K469DRAFT_695038 [Zopfia rhizophila CBS 207.26]|uniref:Uncharacterized protein n=1 Tax=Zopfia rhizophila CBS 207.26 TaxID=1314779 RepID=A0A6A6DI19_9PEZI|nr:hypothetical protein K469DRAFT_695038 [Zopfia rhizophila CBS 207.26]
MPSGQSDTSTSSTTASTGQENSASTSSTTTSTGQVNSASTSSTTTSTGQVDSATTSANGSNRQTGDSTSNDTAQHSQGTPSISIDSFVRTATGGNALEYLDALSERPESK